MNKFARKLALGAAAATAVLASPAMADGGLTFQIVGDTFSVPYTITNTSTAGETVLAFGVSLIAPYGFDTVNGGFGIDSAAAFAPVGSTATATGYTGPSSFADGATSLDFTFTDFDVGESFSWYIDVDTPSAVTVLGRDLVGSTGYADFSNGKRGLGVFEALGSQGSQFVIKTFTDTPPPTGAVPEPATWALMILGFGAIGGAMRSTRRRQRLAVTYA